MVFQLEYFAVSFPSLHIPVCNMGTAGCSAIRFHGVKINNLRSIRFLMCHSTGDRERIAERGSAEAGAS